LDRFPKRRDKVVVEHLVSATLAFCLNHELEALLACAYVGPAFAPLPNCDGVTLASEKLRDGFLNRLFVDP
jgi:hypothetical protein